MFHPGDIVSYGTNGVCEITEQKRVRLAGQPCDCLILKPVYDQSMTICVPCTSQVLLDRMRPLPTKEELLAMPARPRARGFRPLTTALCARRRTCCTASSRTFWASSLTPCHSSLRQNWATNKTNKEIGFFYKRCT